jgi:predicted DCC family thiol-disulfide oxidoreductase YuxK
LERVRASPPDPAWVLYDGTCALCDGAVRWLVARDRRRTLRYAPLRGETAAAVRARHPGLPDVDATFLLVEAPGSAGERVRERSDAALAALARLGGLWRPAAELLRVVPRPLRDGVYDAIARRRERWFGRLAACRVPAPDERELFLP